MGDDVAPSVKVHHSKSVLRVRPDTSGASRDAVVAKWYRELLKAAAPHLIETRTPRVKVKAAGFSVQHMKTEWGSCDPEALTIRLNAELARKPQECLEYAVLHELAHLREPTHGPRFVALMDHNRPSWRETRALLNRLPAKHERWSY